MKYIYILAGGAAGSMLRYLTTALVPAWFPFGTLAVNATGCLLIGVATVLFENTTAFPVEYKALAITGFLGAFTTFSTFALETLQLADSNKLMLAISNIVIQVTIGLLFVYLGMKLAKGI